MHKAFGKRIHRHGGIGEDFWLPEMAIDFSRVPVDLVRGDRDLYTSRAVAERLNAERQQLLQRLVAVLKTASIPGEVAHA